MTDNVQQLRVALLAAARRVHELAHQWNGTVRPFDSCDYAECRRVRALLEVTK